MKSSSEPASAPLNSDWEFAMIDFGVIQNVSFSESADVAESIFLTELTTQAPKRVLPDIHNMRGSVL